MSAPRVPGGNPTDPFPIVNEALDILSHQEAYGIDPDTTAALTWGYLGDGLRWGGFSLSDGTLALTDSAENYVVVARASGAITVSTATTNWNNLTDYARVFHITTSGGVPTVIRDYRGGPGGVHGQSDAPGSSASPVVTDSGSNRDIASTDSGSYIRMTSGSAKTVTFRPNATHALPDNSEYHVRCVNGDCTLTPGSGVTLSVPAGGTLVLSDGMTVTVKRVTTDEFDVIGQTVPA